MRITTTRIAIVFLSAIALGCGGSEPPAPTTTTSTSRPPTVAPTTLPPAATAPSTLPAVQTPEEARRVLQEHGIDPDKLSEQIGEQMRQRFQQQPGN